MNDIIFGFKFPFKGLKFILNNKKLGKYIVFPLFINIILFFLLSYFSFTYFESWLDRIISNVWYFQILFYFILVLAIIFLLLMIIFTFTALANLFSAPFNDLLAEKVSEIVLGSKENKPFSFGSLFSDIFNSIGEEIRKILFFAFVQIGLIFLNLIPVLGNVLFAFFDFIFTVWFLAYEFLDYPLSFTQKTFQQKKELILYKNKWRTFGFGLGAGLFLFIPVLNLFLLPACVSGATLLYLEMRKKS